MSWANFHLTLSFFLFFGCKLPHALGINYGTQLPFAASLAPLRHFNNTIMRYLWPPTTINFVSQELSRDTLIETLDEFQ